MRPPILVTGGTGALGEAVVEELLESGERVAATWIVAEEGDRLRSKLGETDRLELIEADVATREGSEEAVERASDSGSLGGLACLVGGFASGGRLHEAPEEEFGRMVELNLITAQRTARAALPALVSGRGSLVVVGARAALDPFPGAAGYAASKAAVVALAKAIAAEYRKDGVRANAILPSVIDTPANREQMPSADHSKWVAPAEIARVVRFLLSEDSAPTSGAAIPVYGDA